MLVRVNFGVPQNIFTVPAENLFIAQKYFPIPNIFVFLAQIF